MDKMLDMKKMLMIVLMVNLVIGFISSVSVSNVIIEEDLEGEVTVLEGIGVSVFNEDPYEGIGTENLIQDISVGNPLSTGKIIWNTLIRGINPLSVKPWRMQTEVENVIAWVLVIIRGLMYVLLIAVIYSYYKNKNG